MASLAYFIKTCQQEEKYGHDFVNEMDDRMRTLNYAQLQGMQEVLEQCILDGKSQPWRKANQKLLDRVNVHIVPRREEAILNAAKKEEKKRTAYVKRMNQEAKQKEKFRVMEQIRNKAIEKAKIDVKENEFKRQATEKARMMELVPVAEMKRNKYLRYTFLYFVVMIVVIAVALTDPLFVGCGIAFVFISTGLLCYKCYKIGIINQVVVTEDELEQLRVVREEELIQKSLNSLKKTEIEFNNRLAKEREERRAYRAKKKAAALAASAEVSNGLMPGKDTSGMDNGTELKAGGEDDAMLYPESDATASDIELKDCDSEDDSRRDKENGKGSECLNITDDSTVAEPKTSVKDALGSMSSKVVYSEKTGSLDKPLASGSSSVKNCDDAINNNASGRNASVSDEEYGESRWGISEIV